MPKGSNYDWPWSSRRVSSVSNYQQSIGFDAGGHRYICVCGIVPEKGDGITIDNNNINFFEWTSEVNTLCINGFAEIVDSNGKFGEVFSKYFCHLVFEIRMLTDDAKRSESWWEDTSTSTSIFRHVFIIDNAKIVRRTKQFVIYRLFLVGIEWYGLSQNRLFSNYAVKIPEDSKSNQTAQSISEFIPANFGTAVNGNDKRSLPGASLAKGIGKLADKVVSVSEKIKSSSSSGTSSKEPIEVLDIVKSFLASAFDNQDIYDEGNKPKVDTNTFETYRSNVLMHICFGYNHSIMDSIKILLGKLYQNEFKGSSLNFDDMLKMIVYDEFSNKYGIIKYGVDAENFINGTKDTISIGTWESLFGSQFEALTEPVEQDLESVTKKSNTDLLKSFFKRVYHFFSISGFQSRNIDSESIMTYSYNDQSIPKNMKYQNYESRISKENFSKYFKIMDPNKANYEVHGSSWNNEFTVYFDQITNLIYKDVLVLHTKGDITHRPGMKYGIVSDAVISNDDEQKSKDSKFSKKANKEIIGAFNVVKVTHVVQPNSKTKDNFTEKIFLSRNFMAKDSE